MTGEIFYDKLGYTYIELSKFVKADADLVTDLDRWLYVLKNMSRMDKIPAYLRKPIFEKLFSIAEYTSLTKEEKTMYDRNLKIKWDNESVLEYAVQTCRLESARAIALEMKRDGYSVDQIAKLTKLSPDEIEKLE
jgi:hypothetical protein